MKDIQQYIIESQQKIRISADNLYKTGLKYEDKKYKLTPMTVKAFVDFLDEETHRGSYYNYEHQDTQFAKYEG